MRYIINILAAFSIVLVSLGHFLLGKTDLELLCPIDVIIYGIICIFALNWAGRFIPKKVNTSAKAFAVILAVVFSQFVSVGRSIHLVHDWSLYFGDSECICLWILQSLCYGWVFYRLFLGLIFFIDSNQNDRVDSPMPINLHKLFAILVGVRLLFFAAFYPCTFGFDAAVGLHTLLDPESAICDHHPFYVQLLHGGFFLLGQKIGNASLGMALLTILFILSSSAIVVYGVRLLEKANVHSGWIKIFCIIYAIVPLFPYLSVYPTKDGIFTYVFLLYTFTLYEIWLSKAACLKYARFLLLHGLSILLICITRHQGIYIVVFQLLLLLFVFPKNRIQTALVSVPAIALALLMLKVIMPLCNVEPGGKQELYGTLFQQTAYYLQQHPDDVTEDELTAINSILNADSIASKYAYDITDGVKNGYKYNPWYRVAPDTPSMFRHIDHTGEDEALKAYRKAWFSMFKRHPLTCIEASVCVFSGFFYNNHRPILTIEPWWAENKNATTPEYTFWHVTRIADKYSKNIKKLTDKPVLSWFLSIPYYNWTAIFLLSLLIYRRDWRSMSVFFPTLLSVGILLICPVAFGRYTFPIIIVLPLLAIFVFNSKKE